MAENAEKVLRSVDLRGKNITSEWKEYNFINQKKALL
jgi:hypothetical protein